MNKFGTTRTSGILLHPTSLPSKYGIGDLGDSAYKFIDFLEESGQNLWQVLPLGPTGYGDSPYQCLSAFAGNPLLISPEKLVEDGFLDKADLEPIPKFNETKVEFGPVINYKYQLLNRAFEKFKRTTETGLRTNFLAFTQQMADWLEDYALYRAIKDTHGGGVWSGWPEGLAQRSKSALQQAKQELHDKIESHKFFQYLFYKQWSELRKYCHEKKVQIIGDIPIFVAYDSADVWTQPQMFKLDKLGQPLVVAGVPPDYFSKTGQLWGNPIYAWDRMRKDNFKWWIDRMHGMLALVDVVRIDHFRGFAACWEIPFGDTTAENGRWVEVPGREIFTALQSAFENLPIIAEDLGVITPDVEALRDDFFYPGMRILQMAFRDNCNSDLPHVYLHNTVCYTGTHDNDTAVGWFNSQAGEGSTRDAEQIEKERALCLAYLKSDGKEIHWDFIRAAIASVANTAMVPLQDVLGLGSEARMNLPASDSGNWAWRFREGDLNSKISKRLLKLNELYVRGSAVESN